MEFCWSLWAHTVSNVPISLSVRLASRLQGRRDVLPPTHETSLYYYVCVIVCHLAVKLFEADAVAHACALAGRFSVGLYTCGL